MGLSNLFFFFFLIGNQRTNINEKKKMKSTICSWWWTIGNKWNKQQTKERDNINSERDEESVKPQQQDHSKRLHWHKTFNSSNVFSMFSKEWRFRSNQTIHIKYLGIKFQIFELCFPSHWYQQDNNPTTDPGITQLIPKAWSMKVHKVCVTGQWRRRWSTNSPSQQHIQHQITKGQPLSMRLSNMRIRSWAVVHKKKATHLGIFGFQTPFQGNKKFRTPWITWL